MVSGCVILIVGPDKGLYAQKQQDEVVVRSVSSSWSAWRLLAASIVGHGMVLLDLIDGPKLHESRICFPVAFFLQIRSKAEGRAVCSKRAFCCSFLSVTST